MQIEAERKKAMMEELKHYINGEIAKLKDELKKDALVEAAKPIKAKREKSVRE